MRPHNGPAVRRTSPTGEPILNTILCALPDREYRLVRTHLERELLALRATLHESNETLQYVYFPNAGLAALVVTTQDGRTVEVGVVGKEGMVGTASLVGLLRSPLRAIVQIPGDACRMKVRALHSVLKSAPILHEMLSRYAIFHGLQIAQTAACNRLHNVEQRLARWLLTTQDRTGSNVLPITHDFLAGMLGTDRPSVSLAAALLQKNKMIEYRRGAVKILNRKKLEDSTCECYRVIQQLV